MSDISLERQTLRTMASSRMSIDAGESRGDIALRDGLENIAQAIQNRLFTRKGEMDKLGHTSYGSDLYKLIGEPNDWKARARAELYIRDALKNENRLEEIVDISFPPATTLESKKVLSITIVVKVKNYAEQLQLSMKLNLT